MRAILGLRHLEQEMEEGDLDDGRWQTQAQVPGSTNPLFSSNNFPVRSL